MKENSDADSLRDSSQQISPLTLLRSHCAELRKRGARLVDLSMINPDLSPNQLILDRLLEASLKPKSHRYTVARGIKRLREAFAEKYQHVLM